MNQQNISGIGDGNTISQHQYIGDQTLYSLSLDGLAEEDALARRVMVTERYSRMRSALVAFAFALLGFGCFAYFYWNDDCPGLYRLIELAQESLLTVILEYTLPLIVGAMASVFFGKKIIKPADIEIGSKDRRKYIYTIAREKGHSKREWRCAQRRTRDRA
jgi:hypothetical protein